MYKRVTYVSRATAGIGPRDAYDIIRVSLNRNSQHQLTGGLLFIDQHFVQVLEGDPHRVDARYEVIRADPRHEAVSLRQSVLCERLLFANDWMAFHDGSQIEPALRQRLGLGLGLGVGLGDTCSLDTLDGDTLVAIVQACCQRPTLR